MASNESEAARVGKLEATLELYKPMLRELQGVPSIIDSVTKMQEDLQVLRESRIEMRERLGNLAKDQDKMYEDTTKVLQEREKLVGEEVTKRFKGFSLRLERAEITIDSFKLKGWDMVSGAVPWAVAAGMTLWALLK